MLPSLILNNPHGLLFFFLIMSSFKIMKTLTLLMHAGLFRCFPNPSNSDMDYVIKFIFIFNLLFFFSFSPLLFSAYVIFFACVYSK